MTSGDVAVLREMYAAFNRGDVSVALEAIDPHIEWSITPGAGPSPQTFHGHEGVRSAMSSMLEVWEEYRSEPLEFIERGDYVVVRLRSQAIGRASGVEIEGEIAHVWLMRGGKAVRFEAYLDSREALAAAEARAGAG